LPNSVLLKVAWPNDRTTVAERVAISGRVDVGTEVTVNGVPATVGRDGRFVAEVKLADGRNQLSVRATDIEGRTTVRQAVIEALLEGPDVRVENGSLWE
jgi:hypothetical protein